MRCCASNLGLSGDKRKTFPCAIREMKLSCRVKLDPKCEVDIYHIQFELLGSMTSVFVSSLIKIVKSDQQYNILDTLVAVLMSWSVISKLNFTIMIWCIWTFCQPKRKSNICIFHKSDHNHTKSMCQWAYFWIYLHLWLLTINHERKLWDERRVCIIIIIKNIYEQFLTHFNILCFSDFHCLTFIPGAKRSIKMPHSNYTEPERQLLILTSVILVVSYLGKVAVTSSSLKIEQKHNFGKLKSNLIAKNVTHTNRIVTQLLMFYSQFSDQRHFEPSFIPSCSESWY